jgi:hypothetical protein
MTELQKNKKIKNNIKKIQIDSLTKSTKKIKFHNNFIRKRKKRKYI